MTCEDISTVVTVFEWIKMELSQAGEWRIGVSFFLTQL